MADDHPAQRYLAETETAHLVGMAANLTGFEMQEPTFGAEGNVVGIESANFTLGRRIDSLTVFARNSGYGPYRDEGAYTGSHKALINHCRRTLRAFEVRASEISTIDVMQEFGQVAERASRTLDEQFHIHEPKLLSIFAVAHRSISGVPIWTSRAAFGLTRNRAVGFFELHWPEIPSTALAEAALLGELVKRDWVPPEVTAATPQSVDAGVIHSPSISTYMDIVPVIRVVYASNDGEGMKPILHYNRYSERAAEPRSIDIDEMVPIRRRDEIQDL